MKKAAHRLAAAALMVATAVSGAKAANDQFGVSELYPTVSGGMTWTSKWANGVSRSFTGVDPDDAWFDAAHGSANYYVDGKGNFYITGSTPRMYIHDPAKVQQWHDVEMTVYAMRVADDGTAYAGIVGVTRSNHGTTGPELSNLCDTRGYGGRIRYDGHVDFDKETSHPNATAVANKTLWSNGMPKNQWIGYKHVTYDMPNGHVMNEIWMDLTGGVNGGSWQKVNSFEDDGTNMGVGGVACASGIDPRLELTDSSARPGSESGKPNITVYWRSTNVGTNGLVYKNMSVREIAPGGTSGTTTTASAPAITNVTASNLTASAASIGWTTDKASYSQVEYGASTSYGSSTPQTTTAVTAHSVALSGLSAGTLYHYRVKSFDPATGLTGISADSTFSTPAATSGGGGTTSSVISNVAASNITSSGANVTWNTTTNSHSQVEYGVSTSYGSLSYQSTATGTSHYIPLSGLKAGTVYHYRVKSLDSSTGQTAVSGDYTFTTTGGTTATAPVVSAVSASSIGQTAATIGWTTDKASYSQVEYGVSTSYGTSTAQTSTAVTAHSVPLAGLAAGTVYHYRVKSLDPATNLTAVSGDFTFTTQAAAQAPVISNVSAAASATGATFTWNTDKVSHSQVEYGLTTAYGTLSYQSTATGTSHSLSVSGLQAGVTYHYRVKSLDDATGLTGVSGDYTFTTPAPTASSVISNVLASNVTSSGATITWQTTTVSHSQVEYGLTTSYGSKSYQSSATGTYHSIPLSGLKAGTVYHYRVLSLNSATGKTDVSGDYTFKTSGTSA